MQYDSSGDCPVNAECERLLVCSAKFNETRLHADETESRRLRYSHWRLIDFHSHSIMEFEKADLRPSGYSI